MQTQNNLAFQRTISIFKYFWYFDVLIFEFEFGWICLFLEFSRKNQSFHFFGGFVYFWDFPGKASIAKNETFLNDFQPLWSFYGYWELLRSIGSSQSILTCSDIYVWKLQDGWTPLHCAAQAGHLSVVKLLVESGSPTTAETSNGRTPLWFAASENKLKVVTYLIQREDDSYKLLEDRKVLISHKKG